VKETTWVGPKGTTVVIRNGSNKPPRWVLLLIDRVAGRERERRNSTRQFTKVGIRWTQGTGGGRFYGSIDWYPVIAVRAKGYGTKFEKEILIHELAHWTGDQRGHGPKFYEAMLRIARAEGTVGMLGNYPKAKMKRARAALKEAAA
jgi:hypothetical protein